jgi:hypothetical protein
MKTLKTLALTLAVTAAMAAPASAYFFTCGTFRAGVLSADEFVNGAVVGHTVGVSDQLAAQLCSVRDRRCSCLQNIGQSRASQYGREVGRLIAACPANQPAVAKIMTAALNVCR